MFRFSEWLEIDSFVDSVKFETARRAALLESFQAILKAAKQVLCPNLVLEASEEEEGPKDEILKRIQDSLMIIRKQGVKNRQRLVEAAKISSEWIQKFNRNEDVDDPDFSEFSDVLKPKEIENKDVLEISILILSKLGYCTDSEADDMLEGFKLDEEHPKSRSSYLTLENKLAAAAAETGNKNVKLWRWHRGRSNFSDNVSRAMEELRSSIQRLYQQNIERKIRRARRDGKHFDEGDLFNDFYMQLLDMASRRKWSGGELMPWGSGTKFEKILGLDAFDRLGHLDRYIKSMISTRTGTIANKARGMTSSEIGKKDEIHNNEQRKAALIRDDLELYRSWLDETSNEPDATAPSEDPLKFYVDNLGSTSEDEIVSGAKGKDVMRLKIIKAIKEEIRLNPEKSKEIGLSLDPRKIAKTLESYLNGFLRVRKRSTKAASEFADEDGSPEEVVSSMAVGRMRRSGSYSSEDEDRPASSLGLMGASSSDLMGRFFRPYIIMAIKELASGSGEYAGIKALVACIKFNIPCSFKTKDNGSISQLVVKESESIDENLDERVRDYLFGSGQEGGQLFGAGSPWSKWSDEDHVDDKGLPNPNRKTLHKDSFCDTLFRTLSRSRDISYDTITKIISEIPETTHRTGDEEAKHFEYDPQMFSSGWAPTGRKNSLMKTNRKGELVPIYGIGSVSEFFAGNQRGQVGIFANLCDTIFDKILKKNDVSLKSIMMGRRLEDERRRAEFQRERQDRDQRYRSAISKMNRPARPALASGPNPLGRFLRKDQQAEESPEEE